MATTQKIDKIEDERGTAIVQLIGVDRRLEHDPRNSYLLEKKSEIESGIAQLDELIAELNLEAELDAQPDADNSEADLYDPADRY